MYISSPNIISGQSINFENFSKFIDSVPDNIIVLLDQRFVEFTNNKNSNSPINLLDKYKNLIIIRTFNNFYSVEELELTYIIANTELAEIIHDSQIINPISKLSEDLALNVYKDKYYDNIKKNIESERKRIISILKKNKIQYYPSETNYILIDTEESKENIKNDLENKNIILYESNDSYNNYWTLPLGKRKTNDSIINILLYSSL